MGFVYSFLNLVLWVVSQERGKLGVVLWQYTNFSWHGNPVYIHVSWIRVAHRVPQSGAIFLFIWSDKPRNKYKTYYMIVGVMKDLNLKLRDLHESFTLGCPGDWNT